MNWYVLYTKPRTETKVTEQLLQAGLEAYCPTQVVVRQWSDRKKKMKVPLFHSYVFVRLSEEERQRAFVSPSVVRYLFWLGKPAIVREVEIQTLKNWLENKKETGEIAVFRTDEKVKITSGLLKGISGKVAMQKGGELVLELESIGYRVKLSSRNCNKLNTNALSQNA